MSGESPLSLMRADRQRISRRASAPARRRRRRKWPIVAPLAIVVLAVAWCGLWYLAASIANRTLAGWIQREADAGRVYTCGTEGITGFPFRVQVRCVTAAATLNSNHPPVALAAKELTFTAQVYHPTVLVGEVTGPLTVAQPGQGPSFTANWAQARMSVSGLPPDPDSISVNIEQPHLDRDAGGTGTPLFVADAAQFQARIVGGSADNHPVIDAVLHLTAATAPSVHALLAEPLQAQIEVVLRGFTDLGPKPMADRFREMQTAGGTIEIKSLRIARSDATIVGNGTLTLNEHGRLNGVVSVAIAGLENVVPALGIDKLIDQNIGRLSGSNGQPGQGLSALDRLVPGLSGVVRQTASASIVDDIKKMGQQTQIDNKPAVILPLRFSDGSVYLGIIRVGDVPAFF